MAHKEQQQWCLFVKSTFPEFFKNSNVLDFGSLNINGSNKAFFENCNYIGIDIGPGPNVDVISEAHSYKDNRVIDTIISTEMFEHDFHIEKTLNNIVSLLKPGGLFLFTCASEGRPEHGTINSSICDSPHTSSKQNEWSTYYKNLTEEHIRNIIDVDDIFESYCFDQLKPPNSCDLRFWGIKK